MARHGCLRVLWGVAAMAALALPPAAAGAQGSQGAAAIRQAPHEAIAPRLEAVIDFEAVPHRAEPGWNFDQVLVLAGARLGEAFVGQTTSAEGRFDRISGRPVAPLAVRAGVRGQNISVAYHRGLGSMAALPLGPVGFPALAGRGEGALAVRFPAPQAAIALKVHGEYPDPLGARPATGRVHLAFYGADGALLGQVQVRLVPGVNRLAFATADGAARIAGVLITSDDPGGIAVDDIRFSRLEGLS